MARTLADMDLFSIVEAGKVIISERGIYRQVELYERSGALFAAFKGGFVRLLARGLSTVPYVKWEAIEGIAYNEEYNGPKYPKADGLRLVAAE
ncbi:hypothetical protein SAMN04488498_110193 [Mesorhizobium albiziae]|uniref:Uncharacterized protein n=1 Tax=Neomesorhizobium albiziae TaxID=335020 RepID=A0A1I4BM26_9HYPH|nr:hypothetical protein [Mesorhizobium albiziae]GLS29925.1 hypothetical protein GCM10007937_16330 [Mesorhizobium albiziae]SFK68921.1 hypothetical protein SAMN04488498_110193 [Mesorhizobium albiziae]